MNTILWRVSSQEDTSDHNQLVVGHVSSVGDAHQEAWAASVSAEKLLMHRDVDQRVPSDDRPHETLDRGTAPVQRSDRTTDRLNWSTSFN